MSEETANRVEIEIEAFSLLGVVFVALKLCGIIGWSWWWVTLPFWGGFAIIGSILLVFFIHIAWRRVFHH